MLSQSVRTSLLTFVCLGLLTGYGWAQTGANVLVVTNEASPDSVKIAEHYVKRRAVPPTQLLRIRTAVTDDLPRTAYERQIEAPIAQWLLRNGAQDRILYIVLTKGVPLRVQGTVGRTGTIASVDSELTLLYRKMTGHFVTANGWIGNPYFAGQTDVASTLRFSHAKQDIYLVTRLDGFTVEDVIALIDKGSAPSSSGRVLLDQRWSVSATGNDWLAAAAEKLGAQGFGDRVTLEKTGKVLEHESDVLGYYSWGSNDASITSRTQDIHFVPGGIAAMFVSTDARTFSEPPATWNIGKWEARDTHFGGSPQSLTGDLIRAGATGAAGHVAEPFLDSTVRPEVLFPAYLAGFNLAEAFYLAMPALSWQTVVIGDPLCAPFTKAAVPAEELDPPIDRETELPSRFSERRLGAPMMPTANPTAARRLLRAESRMAHSDLTGAREALEEAVGLDDRLTDAWRTLAVLHEQLGDTEKALPIYRRLVERDPQDAIALNNLAFHLADREKRPDEALPLAERALKIAPRNPVIADTLGWVRHLRGDHAGALPLLEAAAKALPENAEVQLHAAISLAAAGRVQDAGAKLDAAERLDPKIKNRSDARELREKLGRGR